MANFELFSSLKANIEKCKLCWLGKSNIEGISQQTATWFHW